MIFNLVNALRLERNDAIPSNAGAKIMSILRIKQVCETTALSKATIYREIKKGKFPTPIQLTDRNVGWRESDINAWVLSRKKVDLTRSPETWRVE